MPDGIIGGLGNLAALAQNNVKRQLAYANDVVKARICQNPLSNQHAQRNRQIERRPGLFHIGRGEVYHRLRLWMPVPAVDDRASDPLDTLLDRRIGQSNNDRLLESAPANVNLNLADYTVNPFEGNTMQSRQHTNPFL